MKITQARLQPPSIRRGEALRPGASAGFAAELAGEPAARPSGAAPAGLVDALLAAQELPDTLAERKKARVRGESILQRLDDIRLGLLAGTIPVGRLSELARIVRDQRDQVADPRLRDVMDEIELRAEVELAKLGIESET